MTDAERGAFGVWDNANACHVRALYSQMVRLEADLLRDMPVFSILTSHSQVQAEERVQKLFEEQELTDEEAMIIRSIVPFFNAVWQNGYSPQPTGGALVCAATQCVRDQGHTRIPFPWSRRTCCERSSPSRNWTRARAPAERAAPQGGARQHRCGARVLLGPQLGEPRVHVAATLKHALELAIDI